MSETIGLIAGGGRLPSLVAEGIRSAGHPVACVGLRDQFDETLPRLCDHFKTAGIVQIGRWIRVLKRAGVSQAIMVGTVRKERMHARFRILRQWPDWRGYKLILRAFRTDNRPETLLKNVAHELAAGGIELVDSTKYIPDHLADEGVMTNRQPTAPQQADIDFAAPLVRELCSMHIGQGVVVAEREIICVEAMEGTDRMLDRAAELRPRGGWILVKGSHPDKDMRFDVPTVGVQTLERLKKYKAAVLAVDAGRTILLDKPQFLAEADRLKIPIVGIKF